MISVSVIIGFLAVLQRQTEYTILSAVWCFQYTELDHQHHMRNNFQMENF